MSAGLEKYYDVRGTEGPKGRDAAGPPRDRKWLDAHELRIAGAESAQRFALDIQGIQCTACVWLLEETFRREPGAVDVGVNPVLGTIDLVVDRAFPLRAWIEQIERFGYRIGPRGKRGDDGASTLLVRMGVSIAIAMNSMVFSLSLYLGLTEGPIHALMHNASFVLAALAVVVGGSVFFQSAFRSLRRGVLHMDVPIALGIAASFAGAAYSFFGGGTASYFDTISIFIALMLTGRFLQERLIERNRRALLADDGVSSLLARRVRGGVVEVVPCASLRAGDTLLLAPGDLVPVEALSDSDEVVVSLDWISGESAPNTMRRGEPIPAGAINSGSSAFTAIAITDFDASPVLTLLREPAERDSDGARATPFWQRLAERYVVFVLGAATIVGTAWAVSTHDVIRTIDVVTALLVVTCPCALGIATPLGYELVYAGLRRAGLFVRGRGFLDRAVDVRKVVFDKTGTLTTGALELADPSELEALNAEDRAVLYDLAVRSAHPKSAAIVRAIGQGRLDVSRVVVERSGLGLECRTDRGLFRLGSRFFATGRGAPHVRDASEPDLTFARDGEILAQLATREVLRADAGAEIAALGREGYEVFVLSGDSQARVSSLARTLGVPEARAIGGASPSAKEAFLAAHDRRDTLMIGDGLNDSLVVGGAFCSGTPAIDQPFLPARSDFYFVTPGLEPIGLALRAAHALRAVTRRNLGVAIAYNLLAVGLCAAGVMRPWLAAVLMPASSILVILVTVASLGRKNALWKSSR